MKNTKRLIFTVAFIVLISSLASAAQLKKETLEAFNTYDRLTRQRFEAEKENKFLYFDHLSDSERNAIRQRLASGEVVIERMKTLDGGREIEVPDGLIHHWRAIVYIPGTTLTKTVALVQDYNNHNRYYAPDVVRSRLLKRDGNDFHILYRLRRRKVITVVMDTEYDVHYEPISTTRMASQSISSRIQEIENPDQQTEKAKPIGDDGGFMWRLNSYWHMEEKDGGVYVQCEAVSLSRDIPTGIGWMVRPFVESVPKESLVFTLGHTRDALLKK